MYDVNKPEQADPNRWLKPLFYVLGAVALLAFIAALLAGGALAAWRLGFVVAPFMIGGFVIYALYKVAESLGPAEGSDPRGKK